MVVVWLLTVEAESVVPVVANVTEVVGVADVSLVGARVAVAVSVEEAVVERLAASSP